MLSTAGDQVPVKLLFEVVGRVKVPLEHIGAIELNVGATGELTLTVIVAVVAHCPDVGVKV